MNQPPPSNASFWRAMLTAALIELAVTLIVYWASGPH